MPSGSKKRKAAKKKKENQQPDHAGDDDLKHEDGKDSDIVEVSSSTSQDHHSPQNPTTEEEIEKEKNIIYRPYEEELNIKGEPKIVVEKENVVKIVSEFESDTKDRSIGNDDPSDQGSSDGSSSSTSSLDDESHGIKNNPDVVDHSPVIDSMNDIIEEAGDPVLGDSRAVESEKNVTSCEIESEFAENGEKKLCSLEDKVGISGAVLDAASEIEEEAIVESVDSTAIVLVVHEEDWGFTEPLLTPSPPAVQTTWWKSCCGLFEVFSRSGR